MRTSNVSWNRQEHSFISTTNQSHAPPSITVLRANPTTSSLPPSLTANQKCNQIYFTKHAIHNTCTTFVILNCSQGISLLFYVFAQMKSVIVCISQSLGSGQEAEMQKKISSVHKNIPAIRWKSLTITTNLYHFLNGYFKSLSYKRTYVSKELSAHHNRLLEVLLHGTLLQARQIHSMKLLIPTAMHHTLSAVPCNIISKSTTVLREIFVLRIIRV